ncbi:hypothetical protein EZS27_012368 [termite gut metagenome]|uniref:Uncharacterized protein n=1 Tax=termite gut metagenome TaxID=433724 RepID=A0A5J4S0U6_9ZZZZ
MESRIRRKVYVRFGGEYLETYRCKRRQGAGCLAYGSLRGDATPGCNGFMNH